MNIKLYTTNKKSALAESVIPMQPDVKEIENEVVSLYPEVTYQTMEGFGGAITDAAGYVYSMMCEEQKKQLMEEYFSPERMAYPIVRIHLDSCDFSTEMYEAMSDPNDRELRSFSFARTEKYIIPMLEDAQKAAGRPLEIMLSPWSPPAFMKTNGSRIQGGKLKPECYGFWADYLCRYIQEFRSRGYLVRRMSLQNETHAVQTWDSCIYEAEDERVFLRDFLTPALHREGLDDIEVFIWDHNKERAYERVRDTVDATTKDMISGVACHWYSGDHFESLDMISRCYPDMKMIISESCIEYRFFDGEGHDVTAGKLAHEMIGDLAHGVCAFYDWNLLLNEAGGPNHVGNFCHALFLYDRKNQKLLPQLHQKYYYHFGHFIKTGAKRIGCSKYSPDFDVAAFQNPDGEIVFVALNRTDKAMPVHIRLNGQVGSIELAASSIVTGVIQCTTGSDHLVYFI